jgi:hypothetical protein
MINFVEVRVVVFELLYLERLTDIQTETGYGEANSRIFASFGLQTHVEYEFSGKQNS